MFAIKVFAKKFGPRFLPLMMAAGVTMSWGGPARAFDHGDCYVVFAAANVEKVTPVRINAGRADFGDHAHLGGAPQGNAVICWSIDGRVAVKGRVFADSFQGAVDATVRIWFQRSNGSWTNSFERTARTGGLLSVSELAYVVSPQGNFRRVRIRLFTTTSSGLGLATRRVFSRNHRR